MIILRRNPKGGRTLKGWHHVELDDSLTRHYYKWGYCGQCGERQLVDSQQAQEIAEQFGELIDRKPIRKRIAEIIWSEKTQTEKNTYQETKKYWDGDRWITK